MAVSILDGKKIETFDIAEFRGLSNPQLSSVNSGRMYFDATDHTFMVSENGGAYHGIASSSHTHDDRYYTESEIDTLLSGKSNTTHNHDSAYATIGHNHSGVYSPVGHNHSGVYDLAGTASGLVGTHESTYDHSLIETALQSETDPIFSAWQTANDNHADWDTAYGWGDHSSVGYLTSESDPVFTSSDAYAITSANIADWDAAYSWGDHAGLYDSVGAASGAVSTHEGTYTHSLIATAYQCDQSAPQTIDTSTGTFALGEIDLLPATPGVLVVPKISFTNANTTGQVPQNMGAVEQAIGIYNPVGSSVGAALILVNNFATGDFTSILQNTGTANQLDMVLGPLGAKFHVSANTVSGTTIPVLWGEDSASSDGIFIRQSAILWDADATGYARVQFASSDFSAFGYLTWDFTNDRLIYGATGPLSIVVAASGSPSDALSLAPASIGTSGVGDGSRIKFVGRRTSGLLGTDFDAACIDSRFTATGETTYAAELDFYTCPAGGSLAKALTLDDEQNAYFYGSVSAEEGTRIGSATDYWTFTEADMGAYGKIPMLTPTATWSVGATYGAIGQNLLIYDAANSGSIGLGLLGYSAASSASFGLSSGTFTMYRNGTPYATYDGTTLTFLVSTVTSPGIIQATNSNTVADPTGSLGNGARFSLNNSANPFAIGMGASDGGKYPMWFQTGDTNGGGFEWYIGTSEVARISKTGNFFINQTAAYCPLGVGAGNPTFEISRSGNVGISLNSWAASDTAQGILYFCKSGSDTIGTHTIVASGETLGYIGAYGSNGTSFDPAAAIAFSVDGTPGSSSDMPGRIGFFTTPDGSATPAERMRIDNAGNVMIAGTTATEKFTVTGNIAQSFRRRIAYRKQITSAGTWTKLWQWNGTDSTYRRAYVEGTVTTRVDYHGQKGFYRYWVNLERADSTHNYTEWGYTYHGAVGDLIIELKLTAEGVWELWAYNERANADIQSDFNYNGTGGTFDSSIAGNSATYGGGETDIPPSDTPFRTSASFVIGRGAADTDYTLSFHGETNSGVLTWMEDEDYFKFSDDILMNTTERVYFRDTDLSVYSSADGYLTLTADTAIEAVANFQPGTDNTYYLGKNDDDSPKAWKGIILKDQGGTGKYYRLEVYDDALRIVDLTD